MAKVKKQRRRKATVSITKEIEIARARVIVKGFNKAGEFVCRLEISGAGVEVFGGEKGGKQLANLHWEGLVNVLTTKN